MPGGHRARRTRPRWSRRAPRPRSGRETALRRTGTRDLRRNAAWRGSSPGVTDHYIRGHMRGKLPLRDPGNETSDEWIIVTPAKAGVQACPWLEQGATAEAWVWIRFRGNDE